MKRGFIAVLVLVSFLLVACPGQKQGSGQTAPFVPTQSGNDGIVMKFEQNAPPSQPIFDLDPEALNVIVEVRNMGSHDINIDDFPRGLHKLFLHLSGYDPNVVAIARPFSRNNNIDYFAGTATDSVAAIRVLEGKSQFNLEGGIAYPQWQTSNIFLRGAERYNPTLQLTACYQYKTTATPVMCIDPNPRNIVPESKACKVQDVSLGGGQGAPVAVSKVEEQILRDRIQFKVWISNVGKGEVLNPDTNSLAACPDRLAFDDFNKVRVVASLGGVAATCNPDMIRVVKNVGFTICNVPLDSSITSAFSTPLNIELFYNYRSSIQKPITIVATP